jgi:hypothetical protein
MPDIFESFAGFNVSSLLMSAAKRSKSVAYSCLSSFFTFESISLIFIAVDMM